MDTYNKLSYKVSQVITVGYSTSFSSSINLFSKDLRPHIYAIYGLVRLADEIVDSYRGSDAAELLDDFETEVYGALVRGYSTNPIIQAFVLTSRKFNIDKSLIEPFFDSMEMDLQPLTYREVDYERYIFGSAEVVGLMCLQVFVNGDPRLYHKLEAGAKALGAAYQKINFLRDIGSDNSELGRVYFPGVDFDSFDDAAKDKIIDEIKKDFMLAESAVTQLPDSSRLAVQLSITYYRELMKKIQKTPARTIKNRRIRVSDFKKLALLVSLELKRKLSYEK